MYSNVLGVFYALQKGTSEHKARRFVNDAQALLTVLHQVHLVIEEMATIHSRDSTPLYVWVKRILQIAVRCLPRLIRRLQLTKHNRADQDGTLPLQRDLPEG